MSFQTPIAFCIFNRPEKTERVFEVIARMKPRKLLIIGDGPRADHRHDVELVLRTRQIVEQIDWPCELLANYADRNFGCRLRMSTGLTWAFGICPELIVLEDDCVPDDSFFLFCETLLERYRSDSRIMMISGNNFQPSRCTADSYYFSRWPHIWGWASWRRAWNRFAVDLPDWNSLRHSPDFRRQFHDDSEFKYWSGLFDRVQRGEIDTWDFSWAYACWANNGLTILPDRNLVSNIGFDHSATHTTDSSSALANLEKHEMELPLRHPQNFQRHVQADEWTLRNIFQPGYLAEARPRDFKRKTSWFRFLGRRNRGAA